MSGDDDGTMRLWDLRRGNDPIMDEDRCTDYISDIAVDNHARNIFVASGEGTMTTYNIKRKKFIVQSENIETDMTSAAVAKVREYKYLSFILCLINFESFTYHKSCFALPTLRNCNTAVFLTKPVFYF